MKNILININKLNPQQFDEWHKNTYKPYVASCRAIRKRVCKELHVARTARNKRKHNR